ncbi:MAG TPA: hypothetical protein VKT32_01690, partial [Chthonomonadaceae bacterium]|nr:hypothetical protein [Chthonomonadaceae bacterium]
ERAIRLYAAAQALREAISCPCPPRDQEKLDRDLASLRAALGEEVFTAAWNAGLAMTMDQALTALTDEVAFNSDPA